jgi:hypothetical protein
MVFQRANPIPRHDIAKAVVDVNRLARELEHITAVSACDVSLVALKATEMRDAAGLIRTWAHLELSET